MNWIRPFAAVAALASNAAAQDTTRVRADAPPLWGENVRLVQEVRIGTVNGPPEYAFGAVRYVAAFPDGAFFVYDASDVTIRRYDAAGRYISSVARKGRGPGEILGVLSMRTIGDSLLAVWDAGNSRVALFDRAGKRLREFLAVHPRTVLASDAFTVDPAGYVAIRVAAPTGSGPSVSAPTTYGMTTVNAAPRPGAIQVEYWMRYSTAGALVDSIRAGRVGPVRRPFSVGKLVNFTDRPVTKLLANGRVITGWPDRYRFLLDAPNARPMVIERPFQPIPIAGEERDEWMAVHAFMSPKPAALGSSKDEWRTPGGWASTSGPSFQLPATKPGFVDFEVDPLGRIWVEIYSAATKHVLPPRSPEDSLPRISWFADPVYEVVDSAGRFLGRVALPPKTSLLAIQRNRVWLKSEGPDGEPVIGIYRIVGPRGP